MGEVYLAHDTQLDRSVALKILPASFVSDHDRMKRFVREAKTASAVSHPNVAHIYEIGNSDGIHFIAMEYIEGETLAAKISTNKLECDEIIEIAVQLARALREAHSKGIIHRDIKPANIMITHRGDIKLLDFGLAKIGVPENEDAARRITTVSKTDIGTIKGTIPYMSPEQIRGMEVDHRTDFFSMGAVLYQLTTGRLPFRGNNALEIAEAILNQGCPSPRELNQNIQPIFSDVICRLLAKDREKRYQNASELLVDLQKLKEPLPMPARISQRARKTSITVAVLIAVLLSILGIRQWQRVKQTQNAREQLLPKVLELTDEAKYQEAFTLAVEAEQFIHDDTILKRQWPMISRNISIDTDPPGADVFFKEYKNHDGEWKNAGKTPLKNYRVFRGMFRFKISKPGFQTVYRIVPEFWYHDATNLLVHLDRESESMVRIPKGKLELPPSDIDQFLMDRYEVTNKEFKKFVDAGGYKDQKYWKHSFIKNGKKLSWKEGMKEFLDTTGRPAPVGWELADYPPGEGNKPVGGVSWYEAAAYAEFVGKHLPTVAHWRYAAGVQANFEIIPLSNFSGQGPHSSGSEKSMNLFGTFDMAGNLKEWVWNETWNDQRMILGGDYNDQVYLFYSYDQRPPFHREKMFGFRCAMFLSKTDLSSEKFQPIKQKFRNFEEEKPVSDEVFNVIKTFYDYRKGELDAKVISVYEDEDNWKREDVTFKAAYGNESIPAYLFIPKHVSAPYQSVIFFPGDWANVISSSKNLQDGIDFRFLDFVIKSGRVVVYPVYKGTYERLNPSNDNLSSDELREWTFQYIKDVRRTLDYLETRSDIDKTKFAYYGYSWGASIGAIVGAVEDRFQTMILAHGGLYPSPSQAEVEELNFAPRVKTPVLMINGRYDHLFTVEFSQKPFFRFLGTPEKDKMYVLYDSGHTTERNELIKTVLGWLDRYLGPVSR